MTAQTPQVLLSYCRDDKPAVETLHAELEAAGVDAWWDDHILPGQDWDLEIRQAMKRSGHVLLCLSTALLKRDKSGVYPELLDAIGAYRKVATGRIYLIPIRLDDCEIPPVPIDAVRALDSLQKVDLFGPDRNANFRRLLQAINGKKPSAGPTNDELGRQARAESGPPQPNFHVPHNRNPFFTGRDAWLQRIRESLTSEGKTAISQVQAISGLGGVGKTQTAVEYCYRHYHDNQDYQFVFWIRSETEQELKSDLFDVARLLKLPFDESAPDTALPPLLQWFESSDGWLLVFDNADTPDLVAPYLPRNNRGHVLITSRAQMFDSLGMARPLEMPPLSTEEAVAFLIARTGKEKASDDETDAARELSDELGGLPLALEQAAAYILQLRMPLRRYLELYRTQGVPLIEKKHPVAADYHREADVPPSVATTWLLNFEQVKKNSPAAADLLTVSSFLAPDEIPIRLIAQGAENLGENLSGAVGSGGDGEQVAGELIAELAQFSLAGFDPNGASFSVHRLVQRVARDQLDGPRRDEWLERCVEAINAAFPSVEFQAWEWCERIVPQILQFAAHLADGEFVSGSAGRMCNQAAYYLSDRAQYAEAEPLYRQALEIGRATIGERHPNYAIRLNNLAGLYREQGKLGEAEPLYHQALEIGREALGERHPDNANWLNNLAELYREQGKLGEAEPLYRQALEITREALGERHPDYAISLNNLAGLYREQGKLGEAEPLYHQALEIGREALGERHPDNANWLNNLAELYREQGKLGEAEPLYRQALEVFVEVFGEDHANCQIVRDNLERLQRGGEHT